MKKPKHLFRSMTAVEVEELWTTLNEQSTRAHRLMEACLTSDRQGIKTLFVKEFDESFYKKMFLDQARYTLVDILARKKGKKRWQTASSTRGTKRRASGATRPSTTTRRRTSPTSPR